MSYYLKCVDCRGEFTQEQVMKSQSCPRCESVGIPMREADDIEVKVNWHELRIICMWAERWAEECGVKNPESLCMKKTAKAITAALEEQYPSRLPLTMAGELGDMKEHFPDVEIEGPIQPESRKRIH